MENFLYVLRSKRGGKNYTGFTQNLKLRFTHRVEMISKVFVSLSGLSNIKKAKLSRLKTVVL